LIHETLKLDNSHYTYYSIIIGNPRKTLQVLINENLELVSDMKYFKQNK